MAAFCFTFRQSLASQLWKGSDCCYEDTAGSGFFPASFSTWQYVMWSARDSARDRSPPQILVYLGVEIAALLMVVCRLCNGRPLGRGDARLDFPFPAGAPCFIQWLVGKAAHMPDCTCVCACTSWSCREGPEGAVRVYTCPMNIPMSEGVHLE